MHKCWAILLIKVRCVLIELSGSGQETDDVTMKEAPETEPQLKSAAAALWERLQIAHYRSFKMFVVSEQVFTVTTVLKGRVC